MTYISSEEWFKRGIELLNSSAKLPFDDLVKGMEEAITCFDRVLQTTPNDAKAWLLKGVALTTSGHFPKGLTCLEEAHRLGEPQAAQAIAICRRALGQQA